MKTLHPFVSTLLTAAVVYYAYYSLMPANYTIATAERTKFSSERAMHHVKQMAQKPHFTGSENHKTVQGYLFKELINLGLQPEIQEGYTAGDWGNLSLATNIIATIKGNGNGKALMLLSHYDSSPHSSLGASDAASGVATILEGVRAFLASGEKPENDVVILFSDAEELGLNGAQLFVKNHPLAKNIGLVLNFEARGSGGPSYMLLETNGGNAQLIKAFADAKPKYPVANSLMYSIYKMLPNDTDLTVFREDGNINGFNFAFIDDHFDYHTVRDNPERLNMNTLEHQGTYFMSLMPYFANANLAGLSSEEDYVYFNFPVWGMGYYPFSYILPMLIVAILIFGVILYTGIKKKKLNLKGILKSFLPFISALIICGLIGMYFYKILLYFYPQYKDILHGFTYNGHWYIAAVSFLCLAIAFKLYAPFKKVSPANLMVAPLFVWLTLCATVAFYLKGAAFFVIPVTAGLISLYVLINQEKPSTMLMLFLGLPALIMFSPYVGMFPVGLGLKMMMAATLFVVLIFGLMIPVFGFFKSKGSYAILFLLISIALFVKAHWESGFTSDRAKPTSLVYFQDDDKGNAFMATYNQVTDTWIEKSMGSTLEKPEGMAVLDSKYNSGFSFVAKTESKKIPSPRVQIELDTVIGDNRVLGICITPERNANRLVIHSKNKVLALKANQVVLDTSYLNNRGEKLLTHYISNNAFTNLEVTLPKNETPEFVVFESSYDLLSHPKFNIAARPENAIPMPFVLNDAVTVKKTIRID